MLKSGKLTKASVKGKIAVAFFLVAAFWGILVTIINNHLFNQILYNMNLDQRAMQAIGMKFVTINLGLTLTALLTVLLISLTLSRSITDKIKKMNHVVKKVTEGNLETELDISSNDEIGGLAESIRKMSKHLKNTTTSVGNLNKQIAERKKMEAELRKERDFAQGILETAQAIVLVLDTEGNIVSFNPYMEGICGYKIDEVKGRSWFDVFIPQRDREKIKRIFDKAAFDNTKMMGVVNPILTRDSNEVEIEWYNKTLKDIDGNTTGLLSIGQDITDRKRVEEAQKASNTELKETAMKLEKANRELKDFVYIASHDLREPLRKISSFGGLLKDSLEDKLLDDDKENLKFMIDGADRMTKMIEGLLLYSRVNTKEVLFEEVDLNEVVGQLKQIELSRPLEEKSGVIELPEPLPKVTANRTQIAQLLQNLIGNGLKYQPKDSKPIVKVTAQKVGENETRIEITDNGIGIEPKYKDEIFKMFKRLHSRRDYEGTGIGLAVCKKIMDKHNGQIGIESELGKGSTFWFTLKTSESREEKQAKEVFSNAEA